VVSSDRPGSGHPLTPSIAASLATTAGDGPSALARDGAAGAATQRAAIAVGGCRVEIAAAPALAALTLVTSDGEARHAVRPEALASWAARAAQLLELQPAREPRECVTIRTPSLLDSDGRATIALEAELTERVVRFWLHVAGGGPTPRFQQAHGPAVQRPAESRARAHFVPEPDARALVEAARGASIVAREAHMSGGARGES
jgi:hypothetical protein